MRLRSCVGLVLRSVRTPGSTSFQRSGGKPAVPVAVQRAIRRMRVKEIRSESSWAARAARALSAWWTSSHAQNLGPARGYPTLCATSPSISDD